MNPTRILILVLMALSASALLSTATSAFILGPEAIRTYWQSVGGALGNHGLWRVLTNPAFAAAAAWALFSTAVLVIFRSRSKERTLSRVRVARRSSRRGDGERSRPPAA